jgi:hypothetical protein
VTATGGHGMRILSQWRCFTYWTYHAVAGAAAELSRAGPALQPPRLLASIVPEEEYIHRAPYGAIEGLRLHAINHAQKDTLQEFRFQQTQEVHGSDLRIGSSEGPALHYLS